MQLVWTYVITINVSNQMELIRVLDKYLVIESQYYLPSMNLLTGLKIVRTPIPADLPKDNEREDALSLKHFTHVAMTYWNKFSTFLSSDRVDAFEVLTVLRDLIGERDSKQIWLLLVPISVLRYGS